MQHLRLSWRQPYGLSRIEVVRPVDLETRHQGEFLVIETPDRNTVELRLDQIIRAEAL